LIKPKNIDIEKIKGEKTRFCNFLYSNDTPFRNKFFRILSKYKHIDSPGKSMNNMPSLEKSNNLVLTRPKKGMPEWEKEKIEFFKSYKFTIAFEGKYGWAVSEKIYDAMLANSIPIYWGNPEIKREFNTKSFINYHDIEDNVKKIIPKIFLKIPVLNFFLNLWVIEPLAIRKMIKRIIEMDNNGELYASVLKEPWLINNQLPKNLDDSWLREKLKRIFG
jgi:hypothetical protein